MLKKYLLKAFVIAKGFAEKAILSMMPLDHVSFNRRIGVSPGATFAIGHVLKISHG